MLAATSCDQVQGFGLSKPLPADDLATWVLSYENRLGKKTEAGVTW
jgi:EAL domain-containing protein (putative c-di-GMP-specific phosphodiesterase class I)